MEDLFSQPEHAKNIYVIRRKLAELLLAPGCNHYRLDVSKFVLKIYTANLPLLDNELVDVYPFETIREVETYINLYADPRFKEYQPIIYHTVRGINVGTGKDMTIPHLCELIQYLYRLSNLTAFW